MSHSTGKKIAAAATLTCLTCSQGLLMEVRGRRPAKAWSIACRLCCCLVRKVREGVRQGLHPPAVEPDRVHGSPALFLAPQASKVNGHYPYNVATVPLMSELMKFVLSSFLLYQQYSKDRLAAQVRLWSPMAPTQSCGACGRPRWRAGGARCLRLGLTGFAVYFR